MATATLERGGTTVSLELIETGGTPVASVDLGKPNLNIQPNGALDPRHIDQFANTESYTLLGRFEGNTAYDDAIALCDLIKSNVAGDETLLNVDMPEFDTDIPVAPAAGQEESVSLNYPPGQKDMVEVDLGLTRYGQLQGSYTIPEQQANTPTATGTGPIQLSDGTTTVSMSRDISVSRSVGRPNSTIRTERNTQYPAFIDNGKAAYDAFELSFEFGENTGTTIQDLRDLANTRLQRDSLTLDFNGLYGMGAFSVVPAGGQALRHTRVAGEQGIQLVPTLNLRVVFDTA